MATYKAPSAEQAKEALRRIPTLQLRRAFFEGLQNPLWVEPLAKEGAFSNPPEPQRTDDGLIRDKYWPEIGYLIRVAPEAPGAVVDVLLKLSKSNNAWLRRGVFEIGATIPADQAARLQPLIKSWQSNGFGWRTDPLDLIAFALNLLEGGRSEVGMWFADIIFKPSKPKGRREPGLTVDEHWYKEGLPKVAAALGRDGLEIVLSWLVAYEQHSGHLTKDSDLSYLSRDSIGQAGDHPDAEDALIDAVRDLAIESMLRDAAAARDLLLKSKMILARKIAMYSLAKALGRAGDDRSIGTILGTANEVLFDEASSNDSCRIDYATLARAVARATGEPLEQLTQFIEPGPRVDGDRLREWVRGSSSAAAEVDERVRDYIDRWKHSWLSAIGIEALPALLQTELAELDSRYGVVDAPLTPRVVSGSWTGPNSPLTQDEMAVMTPLELAAHLESWHPGEDWGPAPSHEGQGRELTALLTTNPQALAGVADLVGRVRPTYLRAILQGWEAALKADLTLDWAQVTDVLGGVLAHSDESAHPSEGGSWHDDRNFRDAKNAAVGLLEDLVKKRAAPTIPDEVMSQFALLLIDTAADESAWIEYSRQQQDGGSDALTSSLNWQWPIRMRGLVHLLARGADTAWCTAAQSALEAELARDDRRGASRAVVGEGLGRLVDGNPKWITPKVPELLGATEGLTVSQQIALTTAMAVHNYHSKLYELLAAPMIAAINSTEPIVTGWNTHTDPLQRIGEWVIDAIIRGHRTSDDPVAQKFFTAAPAKVRGEALGHIAWVFMHADVVDDEIRDRFAALWDERVVHVKEHPEDKEELDEFYWFVRSKKFAVEWWLPRLREAAELAPGLSSERYMIGKELAASADVDPRLAFESLKLLLDARDEAGMVSFDLTRNAVPMVIARAIASGDGTLKNDAVDYMNALGEKGNLALEADVNKVLGGSITQDDVDE